MNHREIVLKQLKRRKKGLTQKDVLPLGIFRLGARIHELKNAGWQIETIHEKAVNQYGKQVHFARYVLRGDNT